MGLHKTFRAIKPHMMPKANKRHIVNIFPHFRYGVIFLAVILGLHCMGTMPLKVPPGQMNTTPDAWTMLGGNPQHTHHSDTDVKPPLAVSWKRNIRSVIADHPLTVGPYILCFTWRGNLEIVDSETGDLLSVERIGPALDHVPVLRYPDVYLGLTMGTKNLKRYDLQYAKTIYEVKMTNVTTAPLLVGDRLYLGTHTGRVYCRQATTGDSVWSVKVNAPVYSSPALGDSLIITGTEKGLLLALHPRTGIVVWQRPLQGALYTHPVTDSAHVYIGTTDGVFYAVNLSDGTIAWQHHLGSAIFSSAALYRQTVYVGTNGHQVVAFDARSGKIRWRTTFNGIVTATPLVTPGFVYVGCWDHYLYVLDRATGKIVAKQDVKAPIKTAPIIYRKKLLVHAANEKLWAFSSQTPSRENVSRSPVTFFEKRRAKR